MSDVLDAAQRSKCMAAIRSRNTKPEIIVRRAVHAMGYRFRLHVSDLPGKPDVVFPRLKAAIFVHGCFWHQHTCKDGHLPGSRTDYWTPKLTRNRERDRQHSRSLRQMGWTVLTIWECQTTDHSKLSNRLASFLSRAMRNSDSE
jgi:DNA mismatch endonuclease, patch repair protein